VIVCRRKLRKFKTKIIKTIIFMQIYIFDNDLFSTRTWFIYTANFSKSCIPTDGIVCKREINWRALGRLGYIDNEIHPHLLCSVYTKVLFQQQVWVRSEESFKKRVSLIILHCTLFYMLPTSFLCGVWIVK
jgi:hypothetical protein